MKILVASGASAGHIFPALSFLHAAHARGEKDTRLVLPKKNVLVRSGLPTGGVAFISITPLGFRRWGDAMRSLSNFVKGALESAKLLHNFHPDVVVGFGTVATIPLVLGAWFTRIPTLIHEQNVIPGKATRLLTFFADRVAISFPETKAYLGHCRSKVCVTGNPLREGLKTCGKKEAREILGLRGGVYTILVAGGSQGARRLNREFLRTALELKKSCAFQVIHLTGEADFSQVKEAYEQAGIFARVHPFLKEMHYAFSAADIAVARAGAATLSEIIFFKLPAIFIPYPHAGGHQLENARLLEAKHAAIVIEEGRLGGAVLKDTLQALCLDAGRLDKMREGFIGMGELKDPAAQLFECVRAMVEA